MPDRQQVIIITSQDLDAQGASSQGPSAPSSSSGLQSLIGAARSDHRFLVQLATLAGVALLAAGTLFLVFGSGFGLALLSGVVAALIAAAVVTARFVQAMKPQLGSLPQVYTVQSVSLPQQGPPSNTLASVYQAMDPLIVIRLEDLPNDPVATPDATIVSFGNLQAPSLGENTGTLDLPTITVTLDDDDNLVSARSQNITNSNQSDVALCPYCGGDLDSRPAQTCRHCKTPHHRECWQANRGCTTLGCPENHGH